MGNKQLWVKEELENSNATSFYEIENGHSIAETEKFSVFTNSE